MAPDYDHLPLVNKVRFFFVNAKTFFFRRNLFTFSSFRDPRRTRRGPMRFFFFSLAASAETRASKTFAVMRPHTSTESLWLTAAASVRAD